MISLCMCMTSCGTMQKLQFPSSAKTMLVDIRTTAYTHSERDHTKYGRKTATGSTLAPGTIASDWSVFPVGTKLRIAGKVYKVSDYGSALIKPLNAIPTVDVYTTTRSAMNRWGVKYFNNVEVVEWGDYTESLNILKDRLKYKQCRSMYDRILKKI